MAGDRARRVVRSRGAIAVPAVVVTLILVVGAVLWSRGSLNTVICDGDCGPAYVTAPDALTPDSVPASALVAAAATGSIDPDKLTAAVQRDLDASALGPRVGFVALDPTDGSTLVSSGEDAYVPASTTKLLTGFTALSRIDPQERFTTRVVRDADGIVLVGGGDPYLVTKRPKTPDGAVGADLTTLARRTAAALEKTGDSSVRLGYDASLFTGPSASPKWEPSYLSGNIVTRVSALWADQGVEDGVRSDDPAASAARTFARILQDRGITVKGDPDETTAPEDARQVAAVESATVARIVEKLIRVSDNQAAEVMLRHSALATDRPASFAGGVATVKATLKSAGVDSTGLRLFDGSGLSRANRISPMTLAQTLRVAAAAPRTSALLTGLPISGFTGTLVDRFASLTPALGLVRAKTGTLSGVHSLAGQALDAGGRPVIFAVMTDRADRAMSLAAQAALDDVAASIADCSCG